MRILALALIALLGVAGCAPKTVQVETAPAASKSFSMKQTRTMITGLDQYEQDHVLVLNTVDGPFVIGPEVPASVKSVVHEQLVKAHEQVITIRYEEMTATDATIAHKRVRGLVIRDAVYDFD